MKDYRENLSFGELISEKKDKSTLFAVITIREVHFRRPTMLFVVDRFFEDRESVLRAQFSLEKLSIFKRQLTILIVKAYSE